MSSAKPGNGVDQLRDDNTDTFWQSDGAVPHLINIQFHKKMRLKELCIYTDYKLDDSYTPMKISIRVGTGFHDLQEVHVMDLEEPTGWVTIPLTSLGAVHKDTGDNSEHTYLRAHLVQFAVLTSHQNGRDTHIRQVKIFGPRQPVTKGLGTEFSSFSTIEFQQFCALR